MEVAVGGSQIVDVSGMEHLQDEIQEEEEKEEDGKELEIWINNKKNRIEELDILLKDVIKKKQREEKKLKRLISLQKK